MLTKAEIHAINQLVRIKKSLPKNEQDLPVVMTLSNKMMNIDQIIDEIKRHTVFGREFVISELIRLDTLNRMEQARSEEQEEPEKPPEDTEEKEKKTGGGKQ